MTKYNTVCLSGGGISGISHICILEFLNKNKIINLKKIKKYVSTSVGSIVSFLLIIGYKTEKIIEFINTFDFKNINENFDFDKLINIYGLNSASKIIIIIQSFLFKKTNSNDITFAELKKKFKKSLGIIGTNLTKNREEYFSPETTPDMSVILAIRISISIPIIFIPVKYKNNIYVDGGIFNNFPINYCNKKTTFGITLHKQNNNSINNLFDYFVSIYNTTIKVNNTKNYFNKNNVIIFEGITSYDLNDNTKKKLIDKSIEKAIEFCKDNPIYISVSIINDIINQLH